MISGMISRAQKFIFIAMLMACVVMAAFLIRLRNRAQDRLQARGRSAPADICGAERPPRAKTVTLYVPNDLDDSLTAVERSIPMPTDKNAQARVLLERLIEAYPRAGIDAPDATWLPA